MSSEYTGCLGCVLDKKKEKFRIIWLFVLSVYLLLEEEDGWRWKHLLFLRFLSQSNHLLFNLKPFINSKIT